MKKATIILAILIGTGWTQSTLANGNAEALKKALGMTYEEEVELLADYLPEIDLSFLNQKYNIAVYDSNFELLMEGIKYEYEDIENTELSNLVEESDFVTSINDQLIYIKSK